jgi:hypothetical protein
MGQRLSIAYSISWGITRTCTGQSNLLKSNGCEWNGRQTGFLTDTNWSKEDYVLPMPHHSNSFSNETVSPDWLSGI